MVMPRGWIDGLILSNNGADQNNDIDIAPGASRDVNDDFDMVLDSTFTKRLDAAWAVGSNSGGLFTGAKAADTWYHFFLIRKDSDSTLDAGFDTSVSASNIPAGYTAFRRLGCIRTDVSSNILQFEQRSDWFMWLNPILDFSDLTIPITKLTIALDYVPTGITTRARVGGFIKSTIGTAISVAVFSTSATAGTGQVTGVITGTANDSDGGFDFICPTDTSAQIAAQVTNGVSTPVLKMDAFYVSSWEDHRGRNQ